MMHIVFTSAGLRHLLCTLLLLVTTASFAQKKDKSIFVGKKKGIAISYTYKAIRRETEGNWLTDKEVFELQFTIQNTTGEAVMVDSEVLIETMRNGQSAKILLNEKLSAATSKVVTKTISIDPYVQDKIDDPVLARLKIIKPGN